MERYICIHGHFYQPPRESPWLEAIEVQDSAYPYHDWNERITAECYEPNATSRILDREDRIVKIVNNYSRISFNVGPTLLAWMEHAAPDTYAAILEADRESRRRFGGHGSALAQVYNHMIMPLANARDKQTQVRWGLKDFERRFGRRAEGMWLAETAVDVATLEVLAAEGVRFTVLAPSQASKVRRRGEAAWTDVGDGRIDPTRAYTAHLPSGKSISLFFYDGPISRAVAFERLLGSGESFANRLNSGFNTTRAWPQLVHIATDGETYGHHHRHGDMALAYALDYIEERGLAKLTNYGQYLAKHPPTHEVQIFENSSWSCVHGVERWRANCGCNGGGHPGWQQEWRKPLREALDWLRDELAPAYQSQAATLLRDPWAARDAYIDVVLERDQEHVSAFLAQHASHPLDLVERTIALKLLELQRQTMLMYTSCGWFFDELSGIETVQVLRYAGRAIQLAQELFGEQIEERFLERLAAAPSNVAEYNNGRRIYEALVRPAAIDHERLMAHYAVSSLFEAYGPQSEIFCYCVERDDFQSIERNGARLVRGRARVYSAITEESDYLAFAAMHLNNHRFYGGVGPAGDETFYAALAASLQQTFEQDDYAAVAELMEQHFGEARYSLRSLFRDEQRKVAAEVLATATEEAEQLSRELFAEQAPLMWVLKDLEQPLPPAFLAAATTVLSADLRRVLEESANSARFGEQLAEAAAWGVSVDAEGLAYTLGQTLERRLALIRDQIQNGLAPASTLPLLLQVVALTEMARVLPQEQLDLRRAQNNYYAMAQTIYPELLVAAERGATSAQEWTERFAAVGPALNVRVATNDRVQHIKTADAVATQGQELIERRVVPRATYRLQFNESFTFDHARAIVPYLHELGISDLYASPILQARTGSTHGYDIVDHSRLNRELGGQKAFDALSDELRARGMGLIMDIVPNHMGIGAENAWWMDVLENGPSSPYANHFDIEWYPVKPELHNKVLLPILGDLYGRVLERGELQLAYERGSFFIDYFQTRLPVAPRGYGPILSYRLDVLLETLGHDHEHVRELQSIVTAISYLPPRDETDPERLVERQREKEVIKQRLDRLYAASQPFRDAVAATIAAYNGTPGAAYSYELLDALIGDQAYRLSFWQVAGDEINYRRFFDINELAAIRMEEPGVFKAAHALIMQLLAEGKVSGLRIDHSDGLLDPLRYFHQLQESFLIARLRAAHINGEGDANNDGTLDEEEVATIVSSWLAAANSDGEGARQWPLYVVAEKILAEGERLPKEWAIYGTSGYDWLNACNGIFVDQGSQAALDATYRAFVDERINFHNLVNASKKRIMLVSLAGELNALAHTLERISEENRAYRDFTLNSVTFVLREVLACMPVYRTYVDEHGEVSAREQEYVETAVAEARRRNPRTAGAIFEFIRDTMLLRNLQSFPPNQRARVVEWAQKVQQLTSPVMAKGVEDTAFYVYNRLVALNEVGGHPEHFGTTVEHFHTHNAERRQHWPHTMLTLSTHDTKRSEDVRARISLLSELPQRWADCVQGWRKHNAAKKREVGGEQAPDANDEYLLYQTLLGAWPFETLSDDLQPVQRQEIVSDNGTITQQRTVEQPDAFAAFVERIVAYMQKATKEAKVHTSWVNANPAYDEAVEGFVRGVLDDGVFLNEVLPLARIVAFFGQWNALSQTLLKLTSPGVPDTYQGTELWDLSLVDPDNRRPVDYARRTQLLQELRRRSTSDQQLGVLAQELLERSTDGRIKLLVVARTLAFRAEHEALFADGDYLPLAAEGVKAAHAVAFARNAGNEGMLVVVPRLPYTLTGGKEQAPTGDVWGDTSLVLPEEAGATYRNLFTGETVRATNGRIALRDVLANFPVALWERV